MEWVVFPQLQDLGLPPGTHPSSSGFPRPLRTPSEDPTTSLSRSPLDFSAIPVDRCLEGRTPWRHSHLLHRLTGRPRDGPIGILPCPPIDLSASWFASHSHCLPTVNRAACTCPTSSVSTSLAIYIKISLLDHWHWRMLGTWHWPTSHSFPLLIPVLLTFFPKSWQPYALHVVAYICLDVLGLLGQVFAESWFLSTPTRLSPSD